MANKILVIDDEPEIANLVEVVLNGEGYKVYKAFNGDDGIVLANNFSPDAILLDIVMPGMSGLEVCKYLKSLSQTKGIPIII